MADPIGPTADNLKIAQQLLSAMSQISVQLENQTKAYRAQADLVESLCKAQECFGKVDSNKIKAVSDGLKTAQENTKSFSDELVNTEAEAEKVRSKTAELAAEARKVVIADEFKNGLTAGFNLTKALLGNLLRIGGTGLSGIMGIGKALLSIPGNILNFFQSNAGGGTDPWREALEELRDKFGSLQVGTSKAVLGMMDNVNQFNDSGLRLGRVFGYGRAGAAAAMKEFMKIAEETGPMAMRFMDATKGISGQLVVLTKSTGLTGDALRSLQISADNGGESVATAVQKMSVELVRAQRTFGISVKEMGRDLEVMMKDVGTFGVMSRDTMIKTSVYARKLGLSMEALKKVMDKTLNFEDTANMAGGLAEAFNMNIDAMKMMKAQTPAEKLDQLREAFFRTGKNIDQMSIAERKHLSNLTNLSEEELRIAFAQKNRALTGAAVDAQMKKSQKTQITQEQAMHELADSIKRLTQSGSGMKGGFFDTFFKGFEAGMLRTREFRKVSREIQRDMRIVYRAGVDVGRMFVHYFPGIKQVLDALGDMFAPAKFRRMMNSVKNIFAIFFIDLQRDPKAGVQNFMKNMKKAFFSFFDSNSGAGRSFLDGMKKFWRAFGAIAIEGLRFGIESIRDAAKGITGFLKNPRSFMEGASEAGSGISGAIAQAISYAYKELWPVMKEAGSAIGEMLVTVLTDYVGPFLRRHAVAIGATLFGMLFGPAFIRAGIAALAGGGGGGGSGIFSAIASGVGKLFGFGGAADAAKAEQEAEEQRSVGDSMKKTLKDFAKSAGGILLAVGALAAILYLLMPGFMRLMVFVNKNKISAADVGVALLAVGGIAMLFIGLQKVGFFESMKLIGRAVEGNIKEIGFGIVAAFITLALIGVAAIATIEAFSVYSESQVKNAMTAMYAMTGLFYAMLPLLVVAGLLGAAIIVTGGSAAAAAALGIASIGVALAAIGLATVKIINMFSGISKEKADVATSSLKEIVNLYKIVADSMVKMGMLSILRPRTIISIIEKITLMVRQISTSVVEIINSIDLSGDVNLLKAKAEVFSAVLRGIAAIVTPITNFGTALAENDSIFDSGAMQRIVTELTNLMTAMFGGIQRIVKQVGDLDLGSDPAMLKSKAEVFTVILNGIVAILTPITNFGASIARTAGGFFSNSGAVTSSMVELGILMPIILRSVGTLATGLLTAMSTVANTVDPAKLKAVSEALIAILSAVVGMVSTILSLFNGGNSIQAGAAAGAAAGMLAGPVGAAIGAVLGGVAGAAKEQQDFRNKLDGLKGIFDLLGPKLTLILGAISDVLQKIITLPNLTENGMKAATVFGQMTQSIGSLLTAVAAMINNDSMSASTQLMSALTDTADPLTRALDAVTRFIGDENNGIIKVIKNLVTTFSTLNPAQITSLSAAGPFLASISSIINPIFTAIGAVTELLKGKTPDQIESVLLQVRLFISSIGRNISMVMETLPALLTAINSIVIDAGITQKALILKGVFETISAITNTIMSVRPTTVDGDVYGRVFAPAMSLLGWLFYKGGKIPGTNIDGHGEILEGVLTAISNMNLPEGLGAKAASLKTTFEAIKAVVDASTSLTTLGAGRTLATDALNLPLGNLAILINGLNSDYVFFGGKKHINPLYKPEVYFGPLANMLTGITGKGILLTNIKNIVKELLDSAKAFVETPMPTAILAEDFLNIPLGNLAILINGLNSDYVFFGGKKHINPLYKPEVYFGPLASMLTRISGKGAILTNVKSAVKELLDSAKAFVETPMPTTILKEEFLNTPLSYLAILINGLNSKFVFFGGKQYDSPLYNPEIYFGPLANILTKITGKGAILTNVKNEVLSLLNTAKAFAETRMSTTVLHADFLNLPLSNLATLMSIINFPTVATEGWKHNNPLNHPEEYFGPLANILTGISGKGAILNNVKNEVLALLNTAKAFAETRMPNTVLRANFLNIPLSNLATLMSVINFEKLAGTHGWTQHNNPLNHPEEYFGPLASILTGISGKGAILTNVKNEIIALLNTAKAFAETRMSNTVLRANFLNIPLSNLATLMSVINFPTLAGTPGWPGHNNPLNHPEEYFGPLANILTGISGKGALLTNIKNEVLGLLNSAKAFAETSMPTTVLHADFLNIPLSNLAAIIKNINEDRVTASGVTYDNPLNHPEIYFGPLTNILTGISGKGALLTNIKNEVTALMNSAKDIAEQPFVPYNPDLGASLANMASALEVIDSFFQPSPQAHSIADLVENIYNNTSGRVSHDLSAVVQRYNALSRDLAAMNAINIDASLTRLNDGLGHNRVLNVEHAAANINIQLNVAITARDIESALYDRIDQRSKNSAGGFKADSMTKRSTDTNGLGI